MFSLQSNLDSAIGVFTKAKKKLDDVVAKCNKSDEQADKVEESATEVFDQVMSMVREKRANTAAVRQDAKKYLDNINKIIGE